MANKVGEFVPLCGSANRGWLTTGVTVENGREVVWGVYGDFKGEVTADNLDRRDPSAAMWEEWVYPDHSCYSQCGFGQGCFWGSPHVFEGTGFRAGRPIPA